jgi:hypothetical protein
MYSWFCGWILGEGVSLHFEKRQAAKALVKSTVPVRRNQAFSRAVWGQLCYINTIHGAGSADAPRNATSTWATVDERLGRAVGAQGKA